MNYYAHEKLQELKKELASYDRYALHIEERAPRRRPLFGAVAAAVGRRMRRAGEGLESWATQPQPECDSRMAERPAR